MDLDTYRRESRETWASVAHGWEDRREWMLAITGAVNDWLLDRVDPNPGQTVLEIAAGPGELGFQVAERVGEEGLAHVDDIISA